MTKGFRLLFCICCILTLLTVSSALADFYKYTDSNGVINITNSLNAVPKKYRSTVKVEREPAAPAKPAVRQAGEAPEQSPASSAAEPAASDASGGWRYPWLKPLCYLALVVAAFLVLGRVGRLLPSRWLARVIQVAFSLGLFVFLLKSYVENVSHTFDKLKDDATSIVKKSKERQQALPPDLAPPPKTEEGSSH